MDTDHLVQPELERGRHRKVVHGGQNHQQIAVFQLFDQRFRPGQRGRIRARIRGDRQRIVAADRRYRCCDQIAFQQRLLRKAQLCQHVGRQLVGVAGLAVWATVQEQGTGHRLSNRLSSQAKVGSIRTVLRHHIARDLHTQAASVVRPRRAGPSGTR